MAETPSTHILGTGAPAPDFFLLEPAAGVQRSLADVRGERATVVVFACNHCPFVVHLADAIGRMADEFAGRGVAFVAVNSNDVANYPDDAPEKMGEFAAAHGWRFPYLFDGTQEVAKAYSAACTPDFFVFDGDLRLAYSGQFDDSRPRNGRPVTGASLRASLEAILEGREVSSPQVPSTGCNIKWRAGNAPPYFG